MKKYLIMLLVLVSFIIPGVAMAEYSQDLIPQMTGPTTPSGIASASSEYYNTGVYYPAWKAFNHTTADLLDCWVSADGYVTGWLSYEFSSPEKISKYTLLQRKGNYASYMPKNWTFEAYDGSNWMVLDTRSNITNWVDGVKQEFTFTNQVAYSKYRINITTNVSGSFFIAIGEMEMMEELVSVPSAPTDLSATAGNAQVSLTWDAVTGATSYNVKRAATTGGPYTTIADSVSSATYTDTTVINDTTYYYVVSAVNAEGEGGNSNEVSATPQAPASGDALLVVTMANGADQNYDLSMTEINAFINWYNSKATGVGQPYYCINTTPLAPYTSRTDYLIFDKIVCFKVNQY